MKTKNKLFKSKRVRLLYGLGEINVTYIHDIVTCVFFLVLKKSMKGFKKIFYVLGDLMNLINHFNLIITFPLNSII